MIEFNEKEIEEYMRVNWKSHPQDDNERTLLEKLGIVVSKYTSSSDRLITSKKFTKDMESLGFVCVRQDEVELWKNGEWRVVLYDDKGISIVKGSESISMEGVKESKESLIQIMEVFDKVKRVLNKLEYERRNDEECDAEINDVFHICLTEKQMENLCIALGNKDYKEITEIQTGSHKYIYDYKDIYLDEKSKLRIIIEYYFSEVPKYKVKYTRNDIEDISYDITNQLSILDDITEEEVKKILKNADERLELTDKKRAAQKERQRDFAKKFEDTAKSLMTEEEWNVLDVCFNNYDLQVSGICHNFSFSAKRHGSDAVGTARKTVRFVKAYNAVKTYLNTDVEVDYKHDGKINVKVNDSLGKVLETEGLPKMMSELRDSIDEVNDIIKYY